MQRFLIILLVTVLAAGAVGYLILQRAHGKAIAELRATAEERVEAERRQAAEVLGQLAQDLARTLAVTLADDVARQDVAALEAEVAAVVQGNRIAGVLVLDDEGNVLATSDLRYRDRRLDDPATRRALAVTTVTTAEEPPSPGQLEVDAPILSAGRRVGTLRLFVDVAG